MSEFNFVKFTGYYPRGDTKISINKSGLIRLSSGFCNITAILNHKYVVLYYDNQRRAIALKFTNKKEDGSLMLTKDKYAMTISGKTFINANKIREFGRFEWEKQIVPTIGEVYIIKLDKNEKNL